MKFISESILKYKGWKLVNDIDLPAKCVICIAPHTSNWDFFWGNIFRHILHLRAHFLMKKEWFAFPLGNIMRTLGGIAVDRSQNTSLTDSLAEIFSQHDLFRLVITPEGTRQLNKEWKKGFYFIALKAQVPIVLAFIDYSKKEMGFGKLFIPTGDVDKDMTVIMSFYKDKQGKFQDRFQV
jgi:1-acyl-sn-glycerol-3-phosphate acyltransferase